MEEFKPKLNYNPEIESPLNITPSSNGSILNKGTTQTINFITKKKGFKLNSSGETEMNQVKSLIIDANLTETNFRPLIGDAVSGITIWISIDGTTPDGNLTGVKGDICLGGTDGKLFYCSAAGKNDWVSTV